MGEPRHATVPALPVLIAFGMFALAASALPAADRVPRPEFTSGYEEPTVQTPAPRSEALEYLDVVVLAACLALSGWLVIRARSREGIFLLSVFSIAYFGFFRKGCICPIGAIQNIALALADPSYAIPVVAIAFFALPLVTALSVGRTFCGAVCPFGALQDAVIVKPLRLPRWLAVPLGFLPVVYLGLAVLFAATGAEFIVCRFDPFVNFFRIGGSVEILALGACFLLLGTVVARPYCRFLCPYGVILGWLSRLSFRHAAISPDSCVQCRLCEESCPVDAIRAPDPQGLAARSPPTRSEKRAFAAALIAVPVLVALGAFAGSLLAPLLARVHPTVRLEIQVLREDAELLEHFVGFSRNRLVNCDVFQIEGFNDGRDEVDRSPAQERAQGDPLAQECPRIDRVGQAVDQVSADERIQMWIFFPEPENFLRGEVGLLPGNTGIEANIRRDRTPVIFIRECRADRLFELRCDGEVRVGFHDLLA